MSNVFSNENFAVLGVMNVRQNANSQNYVGGTCFIQRKPESDYGNITILSFNEGSGLVEKDFNVQERFEANVVPAIHTQLTTTSADPVNISNSDISVNSYRMDGTIIS
mgnify:CR=1 FL=1